jgi:hypothetical protein
VLSFILASFNILEREEVRYSVDPMKEEMDRSVVMNSHAVFGGAKRSGQWKIAAAIFGSTS